MTSALKRLYFTPVGPVLWTLATADGHLVKTDEAKLMHTLELDNVVENLKPELCTYVLGGNALLQSLTGFPGTFGELSKIKHLSATKVYLC